MIKKTVLLLLLTAVLTLFAGCGEENDGQVTGSGSAGGDGGGQQQYDESLNADGVNHDIEDLEMDGDVIIIREKMFVGQTNEIYVNGDDYLGKTIRLEGIFDRLEDELTGEAFYFVYRYGPGCCGYDDNAGFEVYWDQEYPEEYQWVEAEGVLESYEYEDWEYLRLRLTSMTVLDEWGEEYVYQ